MFLREKKKSLYMKKGFEERDLKLLLSTYLLHGRIL